MSVPYIYAHPVLRPGCIEQVDWIGSDEDLALQVSFRNAAGDLSTKSFQTEGENPGEICLPSSKTINDLPEDALMASLLMASLLASAIPGTAEWVNQFSEQTSSGLQTAIGKVVLVSVTPVDATAIDIVLKKNQTNNPLRTLRVAYGDLNINNYQYVPQTQLAVIAGAIEAQYPNYVHNYPTTVLTSSQKTDISNYLLSKAFWI